MHKLAHPDPYLKINIAFHAIKNPKQQSYLQVVTCGDASFMEKKRIYLYDHAAQIVHSTDRPMHGKVLTIRQKLALFVLGVTDILNLPTVGV